MKAIFGSSVKKPLMTKVSMRHLNEIVRERNQYSRDAMEAWQDFINLKGRMDGELAKVTKRNNFLVDELESWKQQVSVVPNCVLLIDFTDATLSSSNSKPLQRLLLRRPKNSKSRSKVTSARTAVSPPSSSNRRMMLRASRSVYQAPKSNEMTLSKHLSSSRRLPKSSSANGSATGKSCPLCNTPKPPSSVNATSLVVSCSTSAASSMAKLTIWSTSSALSIKRQS